MILMPITLINILCGILLTSVTGAIFTLLFVVAGKALEGMGFLHIRYELLKVAAFFYLCPVAYLFLKLFEMEIGCGKLFNPTPLITNISSISIRIWCLGVAIGIVWLCYDLYKLKCRYREVFNCKLWVQELFTKAREDLGVSNKIYLCQSYSVRIPCMVGIRKPKLILPVVEFDAEELRMIFLHELTHYKQKDVVLKRITFCILILHFFNPLAWFLFFQVQKQSEYVCDYRVVRRTKDIHRYVQCLLLVAGEDEWFSVLSSQLFEHKHDLIERVKKMRKTSKLKTRSKWSVALVLTIAMLSSNMSVYAASQAGVDAYLGYYYETNELISDQIQENTKEEEISGYVTSSDIITVVGEMEQVNRSVSTFDWTVNSNVKMCTSYFSSNEGDQVMLSVKVDPSDVYIRVGLERADGWKLYVYNKDRIQHTFTVPNTGVWRVFVENTSAETVTVEGSIIR